MPPSPSTPSFLYGLAVVLVLWGVFRLYVRRWRRMRLVNIIDGDTFVAKDSRGRLLRLRLAGVDCPEMGQRNGPQAKHFVHVAVSRQEVWVRLLGRDRYRRYLADVRIGDRSLAHLLAAAGLAYPLNAGLRVRLAATFAWLTRKGVHAGLGQPKPWASFSRSRLGKMLYWLKGKPARRGRR